MPLDPELVPLLQLVAAGTPVHQLAPADARASFRTMSVDMRPLDSAAIVDSVEDTTVSGAEGPLRARVYRPSGAGPFPTVAMFHGGGFVLGDLDTHDAMARAICAGAEAVVVNVDYRLAPEFPFPAAADDAIAATRDVLARAAEFGGSDVVAVAGDSAGGNLSAVATQHVPGLSAQLLVYPATDLTGSHPSHTENATGYFLERDTMAWFGAAYLGDADPLDPKASPLRGTLADLPPALVVTAEFDPLRDEGIAYAEALAAAGVPVEQTTFPGLIHGFFDMGPWSVACRKAVDETVAAFGALLRAGG
ncbi:alpha/beta hydrolase [Nocardioides sp. GY 10113]|uniref:alpha/beta hydrolase n=1 Tax=Nocardioides sp. GY 10113 TaxID=2569761 RepID=UPI0010A91246|nr:alpha/beta hydrolase [Nocardioides sp. GY 10113]TIC87761.1 alpha/beta hydrolase [Nocardioides sp. GY 10113]